MTSSQQHSPVSHFLLETFFVILFSWPVGFLYPVIISMVALFGCPWIIAIPFPVYEAGGTYPTTLIGRTRHAIVTLLWLAVIFAPFRAVGMAMSAYFSPSMVELFQGLLGSSGMGLTPKDICRFDLAVGLIGVFLGSLWGFPTLYAYFRAYRQVDDIPTSKTRSAAIGLSEFIGIARHRDPDQTDKIPIISGNIRQQMKVSSFYLEDDLGRILVDPAGARVTDNPQITHLGEIPCEIILQKRVTGTTCRLMPGDRVYVIGSVEERFSSPQEQARRLKADSKRMKAMDLNKDGTIDAQEWDEGLSQDKAESIDSERLVLSPSKEPPAGFFILRYLRWGIRPYRGSNLQQLFILSDSTNLNVKQMMLDNIYQLTFNILLVVGSCSWLFIRSAQHMK